MARSPLPTGLEGPLRAVGEVPFGKTIDPKGSNYVSVDDEDADVSTEPINIGNLVPLLRQYDRKRDKFFRVCPSSPSFHGGMLGGPVHE